MRRELSFGLEDVPSEDETVNLNEEGFINERSYRFPDSDGQLYTMQVVDRLGNKLTLQEPGTNRKVDYDIPPHVLKKLKLK